jgi:phosphate transport system permease protein
VSSDTDELDITREVGFKRVKERSYAGLFAVCALVTVLTTIAIFLTLLFDSITFFSEVSILEFLTGLEWSPNPRGEGYSWGVVPLIYGTVVVTVTSALVAIPVGTLTAIYLSEYATPRVRSILKPMLELLAGIPTVVYGYFALVYVTPLLQATLFPEMNIFNLLSASLMVGIMIIPMVSSISEDAMSAVPDDLRNAGYGLGATKYEVSTGIVVPASISGVASSYILAISRAIGETMIVVIAAGTQPRLPPVREALFGVPYVHPGDVLLDSGATMTVGMVNIAGGELVGGTISYDAMFAIGLTLFFITLLMNVISDLIAERYREAY